MTIIHKETTSLVQASALYSVVIYMLKDSEKTVTWHQKQSSTPQLSPRQGKGRWYCQHETGCNFPSCLYLEDTRIRHRVEWHIWKAAAV